MSENVHDGVRELYDVHWSHNWSDLPPEQEKRIEQAFEHVERVHSEQMKNNE